MDETPDTEVDKDKVEKTVEVESVDIQVVEGKNSIESNREGYIVVETNYRLYAYTDSNLQIALLGLFTEILYR